MMPFLCKQPCLQPRVLSASQCPPHDVVHDVSQFPDFYDALYYPMDHPSLFVSEQNVCAWLSDGLRAHFSRCFFCSSSKFSSPEVIWNISYRCGDFCFQYKACQLHVTFSYIESSSFSFCRLFHSLFDFIHDDGNLAAKGKQVVEKKPTWLMRTSTSLLSSVCSLALSDLERVT